MKKYFFFIVLITLSYAQFTGFPIYGVGENILNNDPASLSMGNSLLFSGNSKNISTGSPSSIWRSALTRFSIHSRINVIKSTQFPEQFHHSLTSLSLHFPVGNKKVLGLGLQPVFRTNKLNIKDQDYQFIGADESNSEKPIAFKNNYSIDGGISELFLEYSQKLSPYFSGGLKYSLLFGNQFIDDELYIYDIGIDTTVSGLLIDVIGDTLYVQTEQGEMIGINKFRKFSGSRFTMEGRYTGKKHEWAIRMLLNGKIQVRTQNIQCIGICEIDGSNADTTTYLNSSNAILSELSFGYLHKIRKFFGITIEFHKKYPFNIPENTALFNMMPPSENSIHLGSYYQIRNPKIGFWNNLNIRGGTYLKTLDFTGEKFLDYGATIGLGIEFLSNTQSIDFAFLVGEKESIIFNGEYEEYISFHIGITTGEKWFMKRRRK